MTLIGELPPDPEKEKAWKKAVSSKRGVRCPEPIPSCKKCPNYTICFPPLPSNWNWSPDNPLSNYHLVEEVWVRSQMDD